MTSDHDVVPGRRPLLKDVAEAAGVSMMTASRAISGEGRVAAETRERVLREAERLGYRPSQSARSLRANESRLLGFVAPNLMLPVHVEIIQGARDVAAREGYRLLLHMDAVEGERHAPFVSDGDLVIADGGKPFLDRYYSDRMRTVGLMSRTEFDGIDVVATDLLKASLEAFQHLRSAGYRRIGFIHHSGSRSHKGWANNFAQISNTDPALVQSATNDREGVIHAVHQLMARSEQPDALAVVHVAGTPVVLRELQRHRVVIGRDIGFVGTEVSTSDWGDLVTPRMTAVRIPAHRIGESGAKRLIDRLRGDGAPPQRIELAAEIIVRESTPGPWNPELTPTSRW